MSVGAVVDRKSSPCYIPRRFNVVALTFVAATLSYMMRSNLSIAIIDMSKDFGWNPGNKGVYLSSFFWGYITTQLIGGIAARRFGAKSILAFVIVVPSILTMLVPFVAERSDVLFVACRVMTGVAAGATFPTIYLMLSPWTPFPEKAISLAIVMSGVNIGTIIMETVGPKIMSTLGWPFVFYISGGVGFIWLFLWQLTVTSSPSQMHNIDPSETKYINETLTDEKMKIENVNEEEGKPLLAPEVVSDNSQAIKILARQKSFWNVVWQGFCLNWIAYIFLTWLPTYVHDELGYSIQWSGIIAITPNISNSIFSFVSGKICDMLLVRGYNKLITRRMFFTIGCAMYVLTLVTLAYRDYLKLTPFETVLVLAIGTGGGGLNIPGYSATIYDIAPYHPSLVVGVSNTAGTIPGIIGVFLAGEMLQSGLSWGAVWLMIASFYVVAIITNLIFSDVKRIL